MESTKVTRLCREVFERRWLDIYETYYSCDDSKKQGFRVVIRLEKNGQVFVSTGKLQKTMPFREFRERLIAAMK